MGGHDRDKILIAEMYSLVLISNHISQMILVIHVASIFAADQIHKQ